MSRLEGTSVKPRNKADVLELVGRRVIYLRGNDIDRSGRGYYFPRYGTVDGYAKYHIIIDGDYIRLSDLEEMVLNDS